MSRRRASLALLALLGLDLFLFQDVLFRGRTFAFTTKRRLWGHFLAA